MKKLIEIIVLCFFVFISCTKDFAEQNSNPSVLSKPDLRYSLTKVIEQMYNNDYTIWFYNKFDYIYPWAQLTTNGLGNSEKINEIGDAAGQNLYRALFPNARDIRFKIAALPEEDKKQRVAMSAMTYPMQIIVAMSISDREGSIIYNEAVKAPYTNPPLITPKYDTQRVLFDTWLKELDDAIVALRSKDQLELNNQDLIYQGDYTKWIKLCNLLKLKIAARLIHEDRSKALKIAEEVGKNDKEYMTATSDDCIYKRDKDYRGTGNGVQPGSAAKNFVDFMVKNKDPRLFVLYTKNHFNKEVVQQFIVENKTLPSYVRTNVEFNASGNFTNWKAPGEPWVRYYGVPVAPDATQNSSNDDYFKQSVNHKIDIGSNTKTFYATSSFNERIVRTNFTYTYPTKVGGRLIERNSNHPSLEVILGSAAETLLYLAEFKLLGATLPKSAQAYFNDGVKLSVERLDLLAKNLKLPYYEGDPVYESQAEKEAGSTKLKASYITELLKQPDYNLSSDGLEKVYIQQLIHFAASPYSDVWTTTRRSGVPKTGSSILAREDFTASGSALVIPRRFASPAVSKDSKNADNYSKSLIQQGFTPGNKKPATLNSQRIWFDGKSPNYGAGPK